MSPTTAERPLSAESCSYSILGNWWSSSWLIDSSQNKGNRKNLRAVNFRKCEGNPQCLLPGRRIRQPPEKSATPQRPCAARVSALRGSFSEKSRFATGPLRPNPSIGVAGKRQSIRNTKCLALHARYRTLRMLRQFSLRSSVDRRQNPPGLGMPHHKLPQPVIVVSTCLAKPPFAKGQIAVGIEAGSDPQGFR
jgi:hypothetical protein